MKSAKKKGGEVALAHTRCCHKTTEIFASSEAKKKNGGKRHGEEQKKEERRKQKKQPKISIEQGVRKQVVSAQEKSKGRKKILKQREEKTNASKRLGATNHA